ncbi:helix-turn-helix domain-containing protein [Hoeflea sp.]|uniref:helix-turn-helix domain-containing protein n=1 Tax=Hoeflea sp. TaxID=1940281 RepID=UPI0037487D5E
MIFLPIPFLVSFLLLTILLRLLLQPAESLHANRMFALLIGVYAVQTILVGLRWGYDVTNIAVPMVLIASIIPPLSFLAFRDLVSERPGPGWRDWPHALVPLLLLIMLLVWRDPIDLLLTAEYLGYGGWLIWLTRHGPDGLISSRLDGSLRSYRSLQIAGYALIASGLTDIAISTDLTLSGGRHAPMVITAATTITILLLGFAASIAGNEDKPESDDVAPQQDSAAAQLSTEEEVAVARKLEELMAEKKLFRDADLNLSRLARKMGLPARQVSNAINRVHSLSVSQYVNNKRVADACRMLETTSEPVTRIMFEAGFMTKSNFNREFARVTGTTPSEWRKRSESVVQAQA